MMKLNMKNRKRERFFLGTDRGILDDIAERGLL